MENIYNLYCICIVRLSLPETMKNEFINLFWIFKHLRSGLTSYYNIYVTCSFKKTISHAI